MQKCCICGSAHSKRFCCKDKQEYVKCLHCGHVYLTRLPSPCKESSTIIPETVTHHVSECKKKWDFSPLKAQAGIPAEIEYN